APIFTAELQLDYIMNCISEQLQEALTICCPKSLEEAIQIGTKIEYTMNHTTKYTNT
ncbi:hypothetical protein BDC45DRAFT_452895, partial [Circinella umbellata]